MIDLDTFRADTPGTRHVVHFEDWEFPYALVLGAAEAHRYALNVGLSTIRERNADLCHYLRGSLTDLPGVRLLDEGEHLSSIVTLFSKRKSGEQINVELSAERINTSVSGHGAAILYYDRKGMTTSALRISPHYFNTNLEINTLIETLERILA